QRLHVLVESLDERRIAIVGHERREHLHMAPGGAVHAALVAAVDVRTGRTAPPGGAARRELDVEATLRAGAEAARAAGRLAAEAVHRVDAFEQLGMILDPLAEADAHTL